MVNVASATRLSPSTQMTWPFLATPTAGQDSCRVTSSPSSAAAFSNSGQVYSVSTPSRSASASSLGASRCETKAANWSG